MSNVLKFRQAKVTGTQPRPSTKPKYHCLKCDSERFFIHDDGEISCPGCHCIIANMRALRTR